MRLPASLRAVAAVSIVAAAVFGNVSAATFSDRGVGGLYEHERMTIVYPSQPAARAETARRSAEQRASYLRAAHGMQVNVVADDEIGGPNLTGDLLVLGWTNGLIGTERAPNPFARTADALVLGETLRFDPGVDLAFTHASPFNPERQLYFWSRIDPELDRFRLLPTDGSHWVVYDRFLPIAQGMWADGAAWPPRRDPDTERDHRPAIDAERARAGRVRRGAYDLVYDPEGVAEAAIDATGKARAEALSAAADVLGVTLPEDFRIELHVYADEDAKTRLTGVTGGVHSVPGAGELHMTVEYAKTPNPHEEFHLIAETLYGPSYSTAIFEGIAVAAEGTYRNQDLAIHAAVMIDRDLVPTLADLLDEGTVRALGKGVSFPASALLVEWIRNTGGDDALRRVHARTWTTEATLAEDLDLPRADLEPRFRAWVRERAKSGEDDLRTLKLLEQAREQHVAGNYRGVADTLRKILETHPDDLQTVFNLASAQMRVPDYSGAERSLRKVLDADLAPGDPLNVFGYFQLGRLYDLMGRREAALEAYRRVLALPDVHDSHRSAEDAIATPLTPDRLE